MDIDDIEVEVIMGENTSKIFTEALLKLYDNNAAKVLGSDLNEFKKNK
ncbi:MULTISPECIES: hypothetical protein [Clostridium]|uniref:Uncharacterized protein n=1 Tax=Clostridium botulinum (strain Langeland / NCTC 10281 / Type F) TaxID=441772 RepID=A7GFX8_CLOBL|nr:MULTISPECIES: hypothetical protein [Clostridium]ABS40973.1 hypothetical protein CLI_2446 [Clostridium botulinum F str. Langeland]ADG00095.1 hypothetical protein CBF_2436 [Clostridium botulinum F str. 230613]MBY6793167.1 hypothetical protein [Clostridium botulinum]MBY6879689.1 hypothetical protein [Clostridium botulinum]MBY6937377.1 hypothetical protein [Clostridium botulinum]